MSRSREYNVLRALLWLFTTSVALVITVVVIVQVSITAEDVWNGRQSSTSLLLQIVGGWVYAEFMWVHRPSLDNLMGSE